MNKAKKTGAGRHFAVQNFKGISLIGIIGFLALMTIGLAMFSGTIVRVWDRQQQDTEDRELGNIATGILMYLDQNKSFPPNLAALTPDYAPFSTLQISRNARGFPRYLALHPALAGFQNSTGLQAGNLPDARFLVISHLSQDAAVSITTPADFESWWSTDESTTPNLKISRGHFASHFLSLGLNPQGNGGSVFIHNQPINSNGGLLPTQTRFHLAGTTVGFDENNTYVNPEVIFGLTTNTTYWFDPTCSTNKRWNPLDPTCGTGFTVKDEFTNLAFDGNNGTQNWSLSWQESGESDGPTVGKIQVVLDSHCATGNCMRLGGGGGGPSTEARREVNLSGASTATLTFTYRREVIGNSGQIRLEASNNGGSTWTTLQTYSLNTSDVTQIPQSFNLTPFISSNTQIQFRRNGNTLNRYYFADDIQIAWD